MLTPAPEMPGSHVTVALVKRNLEVASVASLRLFTIIGIRAPQ